MNETKAEIDALYTALSPRADMLYQFVMTYADYIHEARDYGTGLPINMVEVHTLTMIEDNPGITVSDLARRWGRTKSAVSQNVKKLMLHGLIRKERSTVDAKILHLYPTEAGVRLSTAHKAFDNQDILETRQALLHTCSEEEIETFYKVLDAYYKLFLDEDVREDKQ